MFQLFFGTAVSQNSSGRMLVKDLYLFSELHNYCFSRAAIGKMLIWNQYCNCTENTGKISQRPKKHSQKHSPKIVLEESFSEKIHKFHKK